MGGAGLDLEGRGILDQAPRDGGGRLRQCQWRWRHCQLIPPAMHDRTAGAGQSAGLPTMAAAMIEALALKMGLGPGCSTDPLAFTPPPPFFLLLLFLVRLHSRTFGQHTHDPDATGPVGVVVDRRRCCFDRFCRRWCTVSIRNPDCCAPKHCVGGPVRASDCGRRRSGDVRLPRSVLGVGGDPSGSRRLRCG